VLVLPAAASLELARTSGAEGYRFEPYRAYQPVNNLAELALPTSTGGQTGDKFLAGIARRLSPGGIAAAEVRQPSHRAEQIVDTPTSAETCPSMNSGDG
jgi:hypothetical protein